VGLRLDDDGGGEKDTPVGFELTIAGRRLLFDAGA
jgi:hypothetical protein